ncbi:MAG: methyltransferase domain-containing protein [Desulfocapsaceae bacterium]|nr:methyltransferase domain-containing protein [Desulfocapsaceae bacterium]
MLNYYNHNAKQLFDKYQSLAPDKVHASWLRHLPQNPGLALDVGGGSGRDAAWLAKRGWEVIVVEPATVLLELGQKATRGYPVTWINDCLPSLAKLQMYQHSFSLILVSGVLMHLPYQQRLDSMEMLAGLMADNSLLVVSLRQGPDSEGRKFYQVPADEIVQFAEKKSLQAEVTNTLADVLERDGVTWQTIIVEKRVSR